MNRKIEQLEQLFKDAADDPKTLRRLADELACRSTARASSLLAAVQSSLSAPGEAPTDASTPRIREETPQLTLLPGIPRPAEPRALSKALPPMPQKRERPAEAVRFTPEPPIPTREPGALLVESVPNSALTVEAAYRSLKVSSSASWPTIESARREIVQKASPEALEGESSSSRATIVERAAKANEASVRLWLERYPKLR